MSDEINKDPIDVDERLSTIFGGKDTELPVLELIDTLTELNKKHMQEKWTSVKVSLVHSGEKDGLTLDLLGVRSESKDETEARVERQEQEAKFVFDEKWKSYKSLRKFFKEHKEKKAAEDK